MATKPTKYIFFAVLIVSTTCLLLLSTGNFGDGFRQWYPQGLESSPEPWDDGLCSRILGEASVGVDGVTPHQGEKFQDVVEADVAKGSIFFLETACSKDLTPRQACAVESAARANPETQVYVLLTTPVIGTDHNRNISYARLLSLSYPNIRIHRLHVRTFSRGTPMELWFSNDSLSASGWIVHHAADALRLLTLWKYGGTYLDLDVVVMLPLRNMSNFACAEAEDYVANGVISLEGPESGAHALADVFVREFVSNYRGDAWSHNGPGAITRVLARGCTDSAGGKNGWLGCPHGFKVYPRIAFYPIHWSEWRRYFNETTSTETMAAMDRSIAAHVWNKLSAEAEVTVGSRQPYGLLASMYCPKVYTNCGKTF